MKVLALKMDLPVQSMSNWLEHERPLISADKCSHCPHLVIRFDQKNRYIAIGHSSDIRPICSTQVDKDITNNFDIQHII